VELSDQQRADRAWELGAKLLAASTTILVLSSFIAGLTQASNSHWGAIDTGLIFVTILGFDAVAAFFFAIFFGAIIDLVYNAIRHPAKDPRNQIWATMIAWLIIFAISLPSAWALAQSTSQTDLSQFNGVMTTRAVGIAFAIGVYIVIRNTIRRRRKKLR